MRQEAKYTSSAAFRIPTVVETLISGFMDLCTQPFSLVAQPLRGVVRRG